MINNFLTFLGIVQKYTKFISILENLNKKINISQLT